MLADVLNHLPTALGALICVGLLVGFWRGLSLRPHEPKDRVKSRLYWFGIGID